MPRPIRHRPRITRRREQTLQGESWVYQVTCTCDEPFEGQFARKLAQADLLRHRMDVAPPMDQRCRAPRDHRMREWDHCPLCAHQLPLPGMEHLTPAAETSPA